MSTHGHLAAVAALVVGTLASAPRARADIELRNDGFMNGGMGFHMSFNRNEIQAVTLVAPGPGHRLLAFRMAYGGFQQMDIVTLWLWNDPGTGNSPGAEIFHGDFQVQALNGPFLQDTPILGPPIILPQRFRMGIQIHHDAIPTVASDRDGTLASDRNFLFSVPGGWIRAQAAGVTGDWILRAIISDAGGGQLIDAGIDASAQMPDAAGGPDGGGDEPDAGTGDSCTSNATCPVGQYCDPDGTCTLDCRASADCSGGATCNSFGQCVGSGGCCQTGDTTGGAPAALALAGLVGLVVSRRRRCRRSPRS